MNKDQINDPYAGQGGSYIKNADGTRTRVEEPTQDHPDGNKPRDADESAAEVVQTSARRPKNVNQGV